MTDRENIPPEVYKVIGAPGTGKTTRVVGNPELPDVRSLVMENLESVPFEEQLIVTYTNAGVDEAADRLEKMLDVPRYRIDKRVSTIHSICYHKAGMNQEEVVQWWHKQDFCKRNNLQYGYDSDDGDIMASEQDEGHALFDIYGWLKSNMKPLEEWKDCPADFPTSKDVLELLNKWEGYKRDPPHNDNWKNNPGVLYDFSDMIEIVINRGMEMLHDDGYPSIFGDKPGLMDTFIGTRYVSRFDQKEWRGKGPFVDTRIMYVDEVQDLTPLQWAWYLMNKLVCEKVYIGGDDDQTIYGWAGANPEFMLDEEGDFEVLEKTYRVPREIWEVCDGVIRQVDKRQEKEVEPHGEGGSVVTMRAPSARQVIEHIQEGDCMVIFRAKYMIDEFREALHSRGIPYRNMSTHNTWSDDVVLIRDGLAKIDNNADKMGAKELEALIEHAKRECYKCKGDGCTHCNNTGEEKMLADQNGYDSTESALNLLGGVDMDRVHQIFDLSKPYGSDRLTSKNYLAQTKELNYYEIEAIKGNLRSENYDMEPDRVRIGTIHSSKGKEADTVVLALDSTARILENMYEDLIDKPDKIINDAERRLYYVGMTRAARKLVLCQGLVDPEFTINLSDLLEDYEVPDDEWAIQDTHVGIESSQTADLDEWR